MTETKRETAASPQTRVQKAAAEATFGGGTPTSSCEFLQEKRPSIGVSGERRRRVCEGVAVKTFAAAPAVVA